MFSKISLLAYLLVLSNSLLAMEPEESSQPAEINIEIDPKTKEYIELLQAEDVRISYRDIELAPFCRAFNMPDNGVKRLTIDGTKGGLPVSREEGKAFVQTLCSNKSLNRLTFIDIDLFDEGIAWLTEGITKNKENRLVAISLRKVGLGDDGLKQIADMLKNNAQIKFLDFSCNKDISPAGIAKFAPVLWENPTLKSIDFTNCDLQKGSNVANYFWKTISAKKDGGGGNCFIREIILPFEADWLNRKIVNSPKYLAKKISYAVKKKVFLLLMLRDEDGSLTGLPSEVRAPWCNLFIGLLLEQAETDFRADYLKQAQAKTDSQNN